ncbi:hypothetical protein [Novosphingobium sp. TCA1]|jgi:hypothetical protein|uniref:hypothetical protein n=1 Tax=Novosphingobium sp. TCA1 TaxID=2682474 RepID=UPI00135AC4F9|nr:hypothetical protein [Novosphingobium sp. TCA1]
MQTMVILRTTSEEDIAEALQSLPTVRWPQDERKLLTLFNRVLDLKFGSSSGEANSIAP